MKPLDVTGNVDIETPAGTATLSGRGSTLDLHVPAVGVLRHLLCVPGSKRRTVRRVRHALARADIRLDLRLRGRHVATVPPGSFVRIRPWSLLAAILGPGPA